MIDQDEVEELFARKESILHTQDYLYALDVPSEKCAMDWRNVHSTAAQQREAERATHKQRSQIKPLMHMVKTFPSFLPNEETFTPHHLPFKFSSFLFSCC